MSGFKRVGGPVSFQAWQGLWDSIGWINKGINMDTTQLKRIADAIEEILRLVKKDMEPRTKEKNEH